MVNAKYLGIIAAMEQHITLHIVGGTTRSRAEQARLAFSLGYHAEVYAELAELLDRPMRDGVIVASGEALTNGVSGLIDRLGEAGIWLPVIASSDNPDVREVVTAMKGGAIDFLPLPMTREGFANLLKQVEKDVSPYAIARRKLVEARGRIERLSKREREVLDWLSEGCSNKAIARALDISPRTVEIHRANMMDKLGANHSAEAVRLQLEAQLQSTAKTPEPAPSEDDTGGGAIFPEERSGGGFQPERHRKFG